jgi:hypothetical protein
MSLVERLNQLPARVFHHAPPSQEEIVEIEAVTGFKLPADLREVVEWSNGLSIRSGKTNFSMMNAYDLAYSPSEPHFDEGLPGMFILGTDNGGAVFYADPNNQVGLGAWAVYLVRMSEMGIPHSMFVGGNFTEAIEALLAETDIFQRPQVGAKS